MKIEMSNENWEQRYREREQMHIKYSTEYQRRLEETRRENYKLKEKNGELEEWLFFTLFISIPIICCLLVYTAYKVMIFM
jgi:hypothetical protein